MPLIVGTSGGLFVGGEPVALEGVDITALANDGSDLFVGTDDGLLLRGRLGGIWNEVGSTDEGRVNCLECSGDSVWLGTTRARLFCDDGSGLEEVSELQEVEGRSDWFTPWGAPPDVRSLAVRGRDSIFVNVHVGGIPSSHDAGRSWHRTIDIHNDVHQVVYRDGVVLAATAYGLATSEDLGESWTFASDGLPVTYCRALAIADGHILMSASSGPDGSRSALYRRHLSGGSFEQSSEGLPVFDDNIDTYCISAGDDLAALGAPDGHLYLSGDAGESWEPVAGGLPPIASVLVASED